MKKPYYLLSYPRSGNHWMRYIIEWFSGQYTLGDLMVAEVTPEMGDINDPYWINPDDKPIFKRCDMPILTLGPIVKKRHSIRKGEDKSTGLIFLIRDYKECILRHLQLGGVAVSKESVYKQIDNYTSLIEEYNNWNDNKFLINYNDIKILNKDVLIKLLTFLDVEVNEYKVDLFLKNIEFHKQNAIGTVAVDGNTSFNSSDVKYHSSKITEDVSNMFDEYYKAKNIILK